MSSGISSSCSANPLNYARKDYAYITMSADQTTNILDTNPVKFNTMSQGNMAFSSAAYQITLKANKIYKLLATINGVAFSASTGITSFQFYNVTTSALVGTSSVALSTDYTTSHRAYQAIVDYIVTPTVDTVIQLNISNPSGLSTIYGSYSSLTVTEIENFVPAYFNYGQYAYVSPQLTLTGAAYVSGGGSLSTTVRTIAQFFKTSDGKWYIQSNGNFTVSSASRTSMQLTIGTGFTFKNVANFYQLATGANSIGSTIPMACYCCPNTGNVGWGHASATTTDYGYSLFAELDSKPTISGIPSDV